MAYAGQPQHQEQSPLGIAGFILGIVGLFTCFMTSPLGLILSFVGMRQRGNQGLAIAGFVVSLIGSLVWLVALLYMLFMFVMFGAVFSAAAVSAARAQPRIHTDASVAQAVWEIETADSMPDELEGNRIVADLDIRDGWDTLLRYEVSGEHEYVLRSAGPDQEFDTYDDMVETHYFGEEWVPEEDFDMDFDGLEIPKDGGQGLPDVEVGPGFEVEAPDVDVEVEAPEVEVELEQESPGVDVEVESPEVEETPDVELAPKVEATPELELTEESR